MEKVALKLWEKNNELAEIFQTIAIQIAHVNSDYEQVHQPGKCRDFLGDMMWSRKYDKHMVQYGLCYEYSKNPYDTEVLRLSLKFPTEETYSSFIEHLPYLHEKEDRAGLPHSVLLETDQPYTLIIEGNKAWQGCVWKLSLYTFYLKVMSYKDMTDLNNPEKGYMSLLKPDLEEILLKNITNDDNPIAVSLSDNHNGSGFVTLLTFYRDREDFWDGRPDYYRDAWKMAKKLFSDVWE